jgi:nucleoside-diphosphate-sugar epimerase
VSKPINLLIIGATSLVGYRLRLALEADLRFKTRFTTRRPKLSDDLHLDLLHPKAFEGEGFSHIIVTTPIWLITDEVLEVLWAQGLKRILAFSSTSIHSKAFSPEPEERKIAEQLAASEARLSIFCHTHDIALTLLRPTLIYDEGRDQNISQIEKIIEKFGFFVVCDGAKGQRQPIHAHDLAKAALGALMTPSTYHKAYDVSGGETLSYFDMVARIFKAKGRRVRIISLPIWLWRFGFFSLNLIRPQKTLKRNINMALRMREDLVFSHSEATKDFGFSPKGFELSL